MNKKLLIIIAMIFVAAFARLIPHAPNFTPVGAMALFAGAFISSRVLAYIAPLLALLISDMLIGFYGYEMIPVYIAFVLIIMIGSLMKNNKGILRVGAASLSSSILFYLITNFTLFYPSFLYPRTAEGVITSYIAGIPFFNNAIAGDLFYNAILFGSFYLVSINVPSLVKEKV